MDTNDTQAEMKGARAQEEHRWLQQLVGDWSFQGNALELDQPDIGFEGIESVRSIGDLWIVAEGLGEICEGMAKTVMILGFDPRNGRFVGTFIASTMTHLWVFDGELAGQILTLETEGPDYTGKTIKLRDTIELQGPDSRVLSSYIMGEDGQWRKFKEVEYMRCT